MAVAGMAAAYNNTVGSALKRTEDKHRIYSARAGHANYFYICGIIKSIVSRKVRSGVGTPVTAKRHDKRLMFVYLHIASTSAIICLLVKPRRSIAPDIHATVHAPQPWHTASLTTATRRTFVVRSGILNSLS